MVTTKATRIRSSLTTTRKGSQVGSQIEMTRFRSFWDEQTTVQLDQNLFSFFPEAQAGCTVKFSHTDCVETAQSESTSFP